ncbi:MAG: hypothetical protein RL011_192 [Pseudomonadota bacterium]
MLIITWAARLLLAAHLGSGAASSHPGAKPTADELRQSLVNAAAHLLDEAQVSYVYGGRQVGDSSACNACNDCLTSRHPAARARLKECPVCSDCSIDCSHFTALVYTSAGIPYPYIETARMLSLSSDALRQRYHLVDLGEDPARAEPGDLLVYDGHVVLLERLYPLQVAARVRGGEAVFGQGPIIRGDIVHATGGGPIRRPGEGIQRQRFVDLGRFRGVLRRILRHTEVSSSQADGMAAPLHRGKLRPVLKASSEDG